MSCPIPSRDTNSRCTAAHRSNEFGPTTPGLVNPDAVVDPEEVFGNLFGGERFHDIIGTISLGREMKEAMQKDSSELETDASAPGSQAASAPEQENSKEEAQRIAQEKEAQREERVSNLADKLARKLSIYAESVHSAANEEHANEARAGFLEIVRLEAEELKHEKYAAALTSASVLNFCMPWGLSIRPSRGTTWQPKVYLAALVDFSTQPPVLFTPCGRLFRHFTRRLS